jgi:dUTP pyrophosphatase
VIKLPHGLSFPGAPAPDLQRQPAGFDLTVHSVARFAGTGRLDLKNTQRKLPEVEEIPWPEGGAPILLAPGGYLVTYNEEIAVPPDCAGLVLPRSSLMRCGATLHSALWDPGYRGRGQGLLAVFNELALYPNARIGQFVLLGLDTLPEALYEGQYQGENLLLDSTTEKRY